MNKILNWTIGSFFRTIGRIIAYLGIGILIAYIFNSSDFNWGGITELFFDRVSAKEGEAQYHNLFYDNQRLPYVGSSPIYHYFEIWNTTSITLLESKQLQWGDGNTISNVNMMGGYDYVEFSFIVMGTTQPNVGQTASNLSWENSEYCTEWTPRANGGYTCSRVAQGQYTDNDIMDYEFRNIILNMKASVINTNGIATECEVDMSKQKITCPMWAVNRTGFNQIRIQYAMNGRGSGGVYIGISRTVFLYNDAESVVSDKINQQTQQQQQNHEETQNYLEDTNTTQANTQGQDFINNFSTDAHGLTGIITAPLNAIQSLVGSTCSNLVLPLPFVNNKSLTLPCMSTIYSQHFGVFYTMYQGIILALISYWVCVRLFTLVKGFKDPEDDKIEVMDL